MMRGKSWIYVLLLPSSSFLIIPKSSCLNSAMTLDRSGGGSKQGLPGCGVSSSRGLYEPLSCLVVQARICRCMLKGRALKLINQVPG